MEATILVATARDAVAEARRLFAADEGLQWVIADGNATVGGLLLNGKGPLVLHRSERGAFAYGDIPAAKVEILEGGRP